MTRRDPQDPVPVQRSIDGGSAGSSPEAAPEAGARAPEP